jgi:hypothetical protein
MKLTVMTLLLVGVVVVPQAIAPEKANSAATETALERWVRMETKGDAMKDSPAVKIALAHAEAWTRHDWVTTRELLAPNVHALVTSTLPNFGTAEFTGIDKYMELKVKAAQLIEPGSLQVLSAIGDERNALTLSTFKIAMGPGGSMVNMVRACLYLIDENKKIIDERDQFFLLSK